MSGRFVSSNDDTDQTELDDTHLAESIVTHNLVVSSSLLWTSLLISSRHGQALCCDRFMWAAGFVVSPGKPRGPHTERSGQEPHTPGGTKCALWGCQGTRPSPTSLTHAESFAYPSAVLKQALEDQLTQVNKGLSKRSRSYRNPRRCWMRGKPTLRRPRRVWQLWTRSQGFRKGSCGGYIREVYWSAELTGGVVLVDSVGPTLRGAARPAPHTSRRD